MDKAAEIQKCGYVSQCMASPASYRDHLTRNRYGTASQKEAAAYAQRMLEEARAKDVEAHEKNLPGLELNKRIRAEVIATMKAVGVPDRYAVPNPSSRSMYSRTKTVDAGYLADIAKFVVIGDGFDTATMTYNRLKAEYDKYSADAEKEAERIAAQEKQEADRKLEQRKADKELVAIITRYSLPLEAEWEDVLEALRPKDQRLDLAVAMTLTRGDWSDGFYRVSSALTRFKIENDEDKDIAADVVSCMGSEDGRVFRDTTWNYGRLFSEAKDQQLAADVQAAMSHARD